MHMEVEERMVSAFSDIIKKKKRMQSIFLLKFLSVLEQVCHRVVLTVIVRDLK